MILQRLSAGYYYLGLRYVIFAFFLFRHSASKPCYQLSLNSVFAKVFLKLVDELDARYYNHDMRITVEPAHYVPNKISQYIRLAASCRNFNQTAAKTLSKQSVNGFVLIRALFEFFNNSPGIVNKISNFKLISDISFQRFNEVGYVIRALRRYCKVLKRSILGFNPFQHVKQQAGQEISKLVNVVQFRFTSISVLLRIKCRGIVYGKRLYQFIEYRLIFRNYTQHVSIRIVCETEQLTMRESFYFLEVVSILFVHTINARNLTYRLRCSF